MDRLFASICPAYTWQVGEHFICLPPYALLPVKQSNAYIKRFFAAFLFLSSVLPAGFIPLQARPLQSMLELAQPFFGTVLQSNLYSGLENSTVSAVLGYALYWHPCSGAIAGNKLYQDKQPVSNHTSFQASVDQPKQVSSRELHLAAKVFLQGAYRGGKTMTPGLTQFLYGYMAGSIATPDSVIGRMAAGYSVPDKAIDVIKIELREYSNKAKTIASRYAWLLADGSLRDFATGLHPYLTFTEEVVRDSEQYHVIIKHRNHLTIMSSSASPVRLAAGMPGNSPQEGFIDFTDIKNIYGAGVVFLGSPGYGMVAGNARNTDQEINANDLYDVSLDSDTPVDTGYKLTDYTLDGKCNATDYQLASEANDRLFYSTAINP